MRNRLMLSRLLVLASLLAVGSLSGENAIGVQQSPNQRQEKQDGGTTDPRTPFDPALLQPRETRIARAQARYRADRASLSRFYSIPESRNTRLRLQKFDSRWYTALTDFSSDFLAEQEIGELAAFKQLLLDSISQLELEMQQQSEIENLVPFAATIVQLVEDRLQIKDMNALQAAEAVDQIAKQIKAAEVAVDGRLPTEGHNDPGLTAEKLDRAAKLANGLNAHLQNWHRFYHGYDPMFNWWVATPYQQATASLENYALFLEQHSKALSNVPAPGNLRPFEGSDQAIKIAQSHAQGTDVPDLRELIEPQATTMQLVIDKYRTDSFSGRGDRRGVRGGRPGPPTENQAENRTDQSTAQLKALPEKSPGPWLAALEKLDFDAMTQGDKIDYLLFENMLNQKIRRQAPDETGRVRPEAVDESGIRGRPVGRDALMDELAAEMISYTPDELLEIALRENQWCKFELIRAAREMGFGDDYPAAIEKVKSMHVAPGKQPELIRDLTWEAIHYLNEHDLVTIPPIASETWRMQMMTPQRQLINPFFTGGPTISVSFPTDTMSHNDKLQSMRGNNIPFARATVHHELIPGHNLQQYMNERYSQHRNLFDTPFWREGWALYWEMVLYDRGFATTPEDRLGFLVWRTHRCSRIIFSLSYHLGRMSPQECVDFLVTTVGFDRNNAEAEVRRSFESAPPLYQAAYMLGGLQFRQLRRELVDTGKMTDREFHDRILRAGSMPVVMVRALITNQPLTRDFKSGWKFYGNLDDLGQQGHSDQD